MASAASAFAISPSLPTASCRKPKRKPISPAVFCQRGSQFGHRREILKGLTLLPLSLPLFESVHPLPSQSKEIEVGSYLPPSQSDPSFVFFKASPRDTPALRAGIVTYFSISFVLSGRLFIVPLELHNHTKGLLGGSPIG